jgi:hypothetical protein
MSFLSRLRDGNDEHLIKLGFLAFDTALIVLETIMITLKKLLDFNLKFVNIYI